MNKDVFLLNKFKAYSQRGTKGEKRVAKVRDILYVILKFVLVIYHILQRKG